LREALRLLALFIVVPLLVGAILGPPGAGYAATVGAALVLASSMLNGRRLTRLAAPLMIAAVLLGAATKDTWWWVLLVASLAFASGMATRVGAGVAVSMATVQAVNAPAFDDLGRLAVLGGFTALGGVYGYFAAAATGAPPTSPAPPTSRRYAVTLAVALAAAAGLAAAFAQLTQWEHITWMVVAVVVLGIPTPGLTERLMVSRMRGQVMAVGIVAAAAFVSTNPWWLVLCALISLTLYLMSLGMAVEKQIMYLSASFMLPVAATTNAAVIAGQRLVFNAIGLGILTAVLLALRFARAHWVDAGPQAPVVLA
jgi:hypothetical protein